MIQDFSTNTILGIGRQLNGLYCFDMRGAKSLVGVAVFNAFDMWHKRLEHLSDIVLQVLNNKLKLDGPKADGVFVICHKAK